MTKQQKLEKLNGLRGEFRGFFIRNYNDNLPSMEQMLKDIEKVNDHVLRFGLTLTLIGDSTKNKKLLEILEELAMGSLHNWVEGNISENDLESVRSEFLEGFGKSYLKKYDETFSV